VAHPEDYAGRRGGAGTALAQLQHSFEIAQNASALLGVLAGMIGAVLGVPLLKWQRRRNEGLSRWCEEALRRGDEGALAAAQRAGVALAFATGVAATAVLMGVAVRVFQGPAAHESLRLARAWSLAQPLWIGLGLAQLLHAFVQRRLTRAALFGLRCRGLAGADGGTLSGARLTRWDQWRMGFRAALLQATWNYERQQGLGWAWALKPALDRIYPDAERRRERLTEHTAYFNTQPTLASLALGAVAGLEEQRAAGAPVDAAAVARVKSALGASLAAVGDRLFWLTLRPAACVGCVALHRWYGRSRCGACYNWGTWGCVGGVGMGHRRVPGAREPAARLSNWCAASPAGCRWWDDRGRGVGAGGERPI
jgi:hypothetical protein